MAYYKIIENNILCGIWEGDTIPINGVEITESEQKNISEIVANKPADTEEFVYTLNATTLEYEPIPRPEEPEPGKPEPTYTLDEAAALIAQEVASNG